MEEAEAVTVKRTAQRRRTPAERPVSPVSSLASLLTSLGVIPILTAIFSVGGFYYVTNGTLTRHTDDIVQIKTKLESTATADTTERSKIRDEFLASQMKTVEGIAKLDTRLAVQEQAQKNGNDTLNKIADTLQKITAMPTPRH